MQVRRVTPSSGMSPWNRSSPAMHCVGSVGVGGVVALLEEHSSDDAENAADDEVADIDGAPLVREGFDRGLQTPSEADP